jgi:hypothetical protein
VPLFQQHPYSSGATSTIGIAEHQVAKAKLLLLLWLVKRGFLVRLGKVLLMVVEGAMVTYQPLDLNQIRGLEWNWDL